MSARVLEFPRQRRNMGSKGHQQAGAGDASLPKFKGNDAIRSLDETRSHKLFAPPVHAGAVRRGGLLARMFAREDIRMVVEQLEVLPAAGANERAAAAFIEHLLDASGLAVAPRRKAEAPPPLEPLTGREREILQLLSSGASNHEIAGRVFVSENTIKFHLKNIYAKLAVQGRFQAIAAARSLGLI